MKKYTSYFVSCVFLSGILLTSLPARAGGNCGPLTLHGSEGSHKVTYVDHHTKGSSVGDHRIGSRVLLNDNGDKAGKNNFLIIFMEDGEKPLLSLKIYLNLTDGVIIAETVVKPVGSPNNPRRIWFDGSIELAVIGGTGKYNKAVGSVTINRGKDEHTEHDGTPVHNKATFYKIDITCDH